MSVDAMKQALEHLDLIFAKSQALTRARDVLHEAIQQAEQTKPVAWMSPSWVNPNTRGWASDSFEAIPIEGWIPLYTAPPQRKPLTGEEISKLWDEHTCPLFGRQGINPTEFARAIEVAHGIKEKNT
jgi:hypothetical protein